MGATVGYHLAKEGNPASAALPLDHVDFGGRLVPVAVATAERRPFFPGNHQAKQVAVVVAPTIRMIPC